MRHKVSYAGHHIKKWIALLVLLPSLSWACGYNGSGQYVRCFNWTQDAQNGIPITASRFDTEDNGFAQGLSSVMTLNGQSTVTANLPMSGFYFTNVGNAIAPTNFAAAGQVQNNEFNYGLENGSSTNAYVVGNGNVIPAALQSGQLLWFRAPSTNTSATTINWDALGVKPILKNGITPLSAGDIISGTWYGLTYDSVANAFIPITPLGNSQTPSWYSLQNIPQQVQNVSNSTNISMTNVQISNSLAVSGSAAFLSGLSVAGDITATGRTVTAATVTASVVNAGQISTTAAAVGPFSLVSNSLIFASGSVDINGNLLSGTGFNVQSITAFTTGKRGISFTTPALDAHYKVIPAAYSNTNDSTSGCAQNSGSIAKTTAGFVVNTTTCGSGNVNYPFDFIVIGN